MLNGNIAVTNTSLGDTRIQIASRSTRIVEFADFGQLDEHELPVGNDHRYMWRLYSYWRIEEKDGGVYLQNESIAMTRSIPFVFAWQVNPLTKSIPRNFLRDLLLDTRTAVLKKRSLETSSAVIPHSCDRNHSRLSRRQLQMARFQEMEQWTA
jgi:hypothetical protein